MAVADIDQHRRESEREEKPERIDTFLISP
jgi:hypothetical protein